MNHCKTTEFKDTSIPAPYDLSVKLSIMVPEISEEDVEDPCDSFTSDFDEQETFITEFDSSPFQQRPMERAFTLVIVTVFIAACAVLDSRWDFLLQKFVMRNLLRS